MAGVVLAIASPASAAVVDNFDDNSLDASKWGTFLKPSRPNQTVTETGGKIELFDGATLYTKQSFNPNNGTITATGELTPDALSERLFFGFWGGNLGGQANERSSGLQWFIFGNNSDGFNGDSTRLENTAGGSGGFTTSNNPPPISVNDLEGVVAGTTILDFTMTANSSLSTFRLEPNAADTSGATGAAEFYVTFDGAPLFNHETAYVMFENNNGRTLVLDNISVVPEPGSMALIGLGTVLMFLTRRVKQS